MFPFAIEDDFLTDAKKKYYSDLFGTSSNYTRIGTYFAERAFNSFHAKMAMYYIYRTAPERKRFFFPWLFNSEKSFYFVNIGTFQRFSTCPVFVEFLYMAYG